MSVTTVDSSRFTLTVCSSLYWVHLYQVLCNEVRCHNAYYIQSVPHCHTGINSIMCFRVQVIGGVGVVLDCITVYPDMFLIFYPSCMEIGGVKELETPFHIMQSRTITLLTMISAINSLHYILET